jgi:Leucine-rich repeat (LRR) protein
MPFSICVFVSHADAHGPANSYRLERLEVHHNRLPTLPKEFEELLELTYLDVSHNEITTYPGRVYKLGECVG